jgi:hypothetical protein
MRRSGRAWAIAGWVWISLASTISTARAADVYSNDDFRLTLDGSLRQLALYTRQTDFDDFNQARLNCPAASSFANCPAFDLIGDRDVVQGFTRLRLEADFRYRDWLTAFVAYDNEIAFGGVNTLEAQLSSGLESESFLRAEAELSQGEHHDYRQRLYRGYVRVESERFELSVGRQRIAWGVGRLWTPIDRFSALLPLNLQPDITPGIDSIDGRFNFDGFSYLQFVYAPGASRHFERWALRLHGVLWDADLSLMGGVFEAAPTVGFDFARNLGQGAIGMEMVFTSPEHKVGKIFDRVPKKLPDYWQIVVSFDINLDVGTGLYLLTEYLYNGNALGFGRGRAGSLLPFFESTACPPTTPPLAEPCATPATADSFGSSRIITNAEHQLGIQFGYDLTPEIRGDFVTLVDIDGGSAAFVPSLRYAPLDSFEISFGVQLFAGPRLSQYGGAEPLVHLLADWYF